MCFIIQDKNKHKRIATKDIVCYKLLKRYQNRNTYSSSAFCGTKGVFHSQYRDLKYDFNRNKTYSVPRFREREIVNGIIEQGIHSYTNFEKAEGKQTYNTDVFKCVIPKDTEYFVNDEEQEYVALEVRFVERLTFRLGEIK